MESKENYHTPSLVKYGHLRTLTAAMGSGGACDGPVLANGMCANAPNGNKTR